MNIKFQDYLAERAWHDTMRFSSQNHEALSGFIIHYLEGAWADTRSPIATFPDRPDYPDWTRLEGHFITEIEIRFSPNEGTYLNLTDGDHHLYDHVLAYEFGWGVQQWETDKYGNRIGYPKVMIDGGLINRARHKIGAGLDHVRNNQEPDWMSHT